MDKSILNFTPKVMWDWAKQRFYKPSSVSLMARDMMKVGFDVTNDKIVVVYSTTLRAPMVAGWAEAFNLMLIHPTKSGALGPAGVLHTMLHELTHAKGYGIHDEAFMKAYAAAGSRFKWFNKIEGARRGGCGVVDTNRIIHPGVC